MNNIHTLLNSAIREKQFVKIIFYSIAHPLPDIKALQRADPF